jgi:hypothetical protein
MLPKTIPSTDTTIKNSKYQKVPLFILIIILIKLIYLDEIPIVLLELNESALAYITREQFEKALLLL